MSAAPPRLVTRSAPAPARERLLAAGLHPVLARVYAARGIGQADELKASLADLLPPDGLLGIATAAERLARARRDFHRQREPLEAKFIERAAASGKPRGLRWLDVEFDDDVVYARDRRRGQLKALVAIEVSFEAVEGTAMDEEDQAEAVGRVRAATAEFVHDGARWQTNGRVYFNLAPSATVKYLASDLEMVAEEHAIPRS